MVGGGSSKSRHTGQQLWQSIEEGWKATPRGSTPVGLHEARQIIFGHMLPEKRHDPEETTQPWEEGLEFSNEPHCPPLAPLELRWLQYPLYLMCKWGQAASKQVGENTAEHNERRVCQRSAYFHEVVETLMAMAILGPGCAGMEREKDRLPILQDRAWTSSQIPHLAQG